MGKGYLGLGDLMFTALFVFIYYRQLKQLGAFDDEPRPAPTDSPEEE
jgi:hypothetical protein